MSGREMHPDLFGRDSHLYGETIFADHHVIDWNYPAHFHEFFEIELIGGGRGHQVLNGKELPLAPGTVYLLTPEDIHGVYPDGDLDIYNVMFTEDFLLENLSFEQIVTCQNRQILLSPEAYARMTTLMRLLCRETKHRDRMYSRAYMQGLLGCALIELLRHSDCAGYPPEKSSMQRVLFHILRHFREPITMEGMAAFFHLSPGYFSKTFKKTTGSCFVDYLNDLRVRYASRLLLSTDMSVTDVCYQSGFNSFSTFSRAFKQHCGVSPSEYRKASEHPLDAGKSALQAP